MLRATTACTFSTSQLPKVVRSSSVLSILTWKCASRHNGVHFFMSHLASWLRTRRFSEPTFRPSEAPNHWKNTVFRDFPTFSRICIFFLLTLLSSNLSLLSASSLLCFSSVHIVGSLASKLPSTNYVNHPASLVTDKTPPFLPEVLVDLLASGADFRPPLHPQPEVGGKVLGLGSQQRFRKLKLLWRRAMRVSTSTTLILIQHVHSP